MGLNRYPRSGAPVPCAARAQRPVRHCCCDLVVLSDPKPEINHISLLKSTFCVYIHSFKSNLSYATKTKIQQQQNIIVSNSFLEIVCLWTVCFRHRLFWYSLISSSFAPLLSIVFLLLLQFHLLWFQHRFFIILQIFTFGFQITLKGPPTICGREEIFFQLSTVPPRLDLVLFW